MIAPGPKFEALKAIAALVEGHLAGTSGLDVEQVVAQISLRLEQAQAASTKLDVVQVEERLEQMAGLVREGDYEAAHGFEVSLYRALLGQWADEGSDIARRALRAETIVTRWE